MFYNLYSYLNYIYIYTYLYIYIYINSKSIVDTNANIKNIPFSKFRITLTQSKNN